MKSQLTPGFPRINRNLMVGADTDRTWLDAFLLQITGKYCAGQQKITSFNIADSESAKIGARAMLSKRAGSPEVCLSEPRQYKKQASRLSFGRTCYAIPESIDFMMCLLSSTSTIPVSVASQEDKLVKLLCVY